MVAGRSLKLLEMDIQVLSDLMEVAIDCVHPVSGKPETGISNNCTARSTAKHPNGVEVVVNLYVSKLESRLLAMWAVWRSKHWNHSWSVPCIQDSLSQ